jgi:hypothetical protein
MRTVLRLVSGVLLLVACTDSPVAVPESPPPAAAVVPTPGVACTSRWAAAVNGSWFDAARWNPAGVPGSTASVCIDVAGTYTITMDPPVDATPVQLQALDVGATGATPTLVMSGSSAILEVTQGVMIRSGATVNMSNGTAAAVTVGGTLTNRGTLSAIAVCGSCGQLHTLSADVLNEGTLNATGTLTLIKTAGAYQNLGTINMGSNGQLVIAAGAGAVSFEQDAGVITSTGNFTTLTMRSGTFTMRGGKARQRNASNAKPIVVLDGANLVMLPQATDSAALAVLGGSAASPTITGDVPALTALWLGAPSNGQPGTVTFAGNPTNAGRILPVKNLDVTGGQLTIAGTGRLTNNGIIAQTQNSGTGATFRYTLDLTNNGTITVTDGTHIALAKAGGTYQNNDSIALGSTSGTSQLIVAGNTFVNAASAWTTGGSVVVDPGGRVMGEGIIGSTLRPQNGGIVDPGQSAGLLTIRNYAPTATGRLRIELGGTTAATGYDQLVATSNLLLGQSTLDIVELNGFHSGLCGQLFEIVKHPMGSAANSWGPFGTINGLNPGSGRQLRIIYRSQTATVSGAVMLVGFDGSRRVCVGPDAVSVAEGAAGTTYAVALAQAPTTSVTVTATPSAQVTVSPTSLMFTAANWQMPQFVTVTAVDDLTPEGTHSGSVAHTVASTDPFYQGFVPSSVTADITDNDTNRPPVAVNDDATTAEDTPVDVAVRGNDSDPDGDPLTVTAVTAAGHGTATIINGGAAVRYTPAANYNGSDAFNYTISDGRGGNASASVAVNISATPDAPIAVNDAAETEVPDPVNIPVLANDSEPDGQPLTVVSVTQPANGTAQVAPDGQAVTYQPDATFAGGAEWFSYTISDGTGGSATASVTVQVRGPNHRPVAVDDTASTSTRSVVIPVLANDFDLDGDPLAVFHVINLSPAGPGATGVSVTGGVELRYDAPVGYVGPASFDYLIRDGRGGVDTAHVSVTVGPAINGAPVAVPDVVTGRLSGQVRIDVLANDSDPNGDRLSITSVSQPQPGYGQVSISGGTLVYSYRVAMVPGGWVDQFNYTISDGKGGVATGSVSVRIPYDFKLFDARSSVTAVGPDYAIVALMATYSGFTFERPSFETVVELPPGTFAVGSGTIPNLTPTPGCTVEYYPLSTRMRYYRCQHSHIFPGGNGSFGIGLATVAVRLDGARNRRWSATLNLPEDANPRNNSNTARFSVP